MALEENIVSWNFTNWITICLMVAIGFAVLGFVQNWWTTKQDNTLAAAA
jgi:hypothetical protein